MATALQIPRVDFAAQRASLGPELDAAIERVLARGRFILGPEVEAFEAEFASYCGVEHCVATGSGTDALRLTLEASGIGAGDEVVTVAHTAVPTAFAVALAGATPVFVDVDPETHTMDPEHAARAIGPATRALLPVHLYGQCADMEPLRSLARDHGLMLVEDACQAHGARYEGRRAGALGHAAAFSFYPTKNLGAYGDGGAVTTGDAALAERLRRRRNHGLTEGYVHDGPAPNSRLDELQAAILRVKLARLDAWNGSRRELAAAYDRALEGAPVTTPSASPRGEHVFHQYVVRSPRRDALLDHLRANGVDAAVHYPVPAHRQPPYRASAVELPVTEAYAGQVLSLPIYPELDRERVERVAELVSGG
ncbi:MAG: DegT/DnrJ/EryC1/StrS family aminotransferase [Thermoleophilaceae bacterium]